MKYNPMTIPCKIERGLPDDPAMSFEEIGRKLGITKGGAWMLYRSALIKLRRRHNLQSLQELRELLDMKLTKQS